MDVSRSSLDRIPDLAMLAALLCLLYFFRRKQIQDRVDLWIAGLLLIFCEAVAHFFYLTPGPWHRAAHIIALDCYAMAAAVFLWAAFLPVYDHSLRRFYTIANTPPLMFVLTLYGADVHRPGLFYAAIAIGMISGVAATLYLRIRPIFTVARCLVWGLMAVCVARGDLRQTAYLGLFYVYLAAAFAFRKSLPPRSTGKVAVVGALATWSLIFLTHPWIAQHSRLDGITDELWNLQAFVLTIGMLIVLLERQISRNEHLALHDQLTTLPNRRLYDDRLRQVLAEAERDGHHVALFIMDLDDFKVINDSFGHDAGDQVLCGIVEHLRSSLRSYHTFARLGGDEFAIICPDLQSDGARARQTAEALAEIIRLSLAQPVSAQGHSFTLSASVGYALFPQDTTDHNVLRRTADMRMYTQKQARVTQQIAAAAN